MKAIMKTIKPKTCANIMNLIQSILVIKNKREANTIQKLIDENGYAEIYAYCTKNDGRLYQDFSISSDYYYDKGAKDYQPRLYNGKVVAKFRCYKVEEIESTYERKGIRYDNGLNLKDEDNDQMFTASFKNEKELRKANCLTSDELWEYLIVGEGYAIHISDLQVFDRPKELSEFKIKSGLEKIKIKMVGSPYGTLLKPITCHCEKKPILKPLTKAPQNFCYLEVE